MGKNSREYAENHFSLKVSFEKTRRIFEELIRIAKKDESDFKEDTIPMLDYCGDFATYPTMMISDDTLFYKTKQSENVNLVELPQYKIFVERIEESQILKLVIDFVGKGQKSIADFYKIYSQYSLPQIRRSFLFLYKYDILALFDDNHL